MAIVAGACRALARGPGEGEEEKEGEEEEEEEEAQLLLMMPHRFCPHFPRHHVSRSFVRCLGVARRVHDLDTSGR